VGGDQGQPNLQGGTSANHTSPRLPGPPSPADNISARLCCPCCQRMRCSESRVGCSHSPSCCRHPGRWTGTAPAPTPPPAPSPAASLCPAGSAGRPWQHAGWVPCARQRSALRPAAAAAAVQEPAVLWVRIVGASWGTGRVRPPCAAHLSQALLDVWHQQAEHHQHCVQELGAHLQTRWGGQGLAGGGGGGGQTGPGPPLTPQQSQGGLGGGG